LTSKHNSSAIGLRSCTTALSRLHRFSVRTAFSVDDVRQICMKTQPECSLVLWVEILIFLKRK